MSKVVPRYIYPCDEDIYLDADGLLITEPLWFKTSKLLDEVSVAQLPGGILLAEGGMGKTVFMQQLKNELPDQKTTLIQLGEYRGDIDGFRIAFESCISGIPPGEHHRLILDSLDEAPELAGIVLRNLRKLPAEISVWISSRDVPSIRSIQSERPNIDTYNLAPLSQKDVCDLASDAGVDGIAFLKAAKQQGILGICAKPIGCELAISVFKQKGLENVRQQDLWRQGIERLCDETPSKTRKLGEPSEYTLSQIVECAAWIALNATLTGRTSIWNGDQSYCPPQSIGISELVTDSIPLMMIRDTISRGVFCPRGDGRIWFAHDTYYDYLASCGFSLYIPSEQWQSLLVCTNRSAVFSRRTGIATWLATWNAGFLDLLLGIQPELLLLSADVIHTIGPDKLCEALLGRSESLSYRQRHQDNIVNSLMRLKGSNTPSVLIRVLSDMTASVPVTETAAAIAEACEYSEVANALSARVLNSALSLRDRVSAAYTVCSLNNESAKGRLKSLLPVDPAQDPQDDLRGLVLRACWPTHLTPSEIVPHLSSPQKTNLFGAYRQFIEYDLPVSMPAVVETSKDINLLLWAISRVTENRFSSSLGVLARSIYSAYWKCAKTPDVAALLAKGYSRALSEHKSPFIEKGTGYGDDSPSILSREAFLRESNGRFAALEIILAGSEIKDHDLIYAAVSDYPLFTAEDLPMMFAKVISDPTGRLSKRWAACINAVICRCDIGIYAKEIEQVHKLRPDIFRSYAEVRGEFEAASRQAKKYEKQWKDQEAGQKAKGLSSQSHIDKEIKRILQNPNSSPDIFPNIAKWINSEKGIPTLGSMDLQQSAGWEKLGEGERENLIGLAERYLKHGKITPSDPNQVSWAPAEALILLQRHRPATYAEIGEDVWRKCGAEILKADRDDSAELMAPLLDTIANKYPEVAKEAVVGVLRQQISRGYISILRYWGSRFRDDQARAVMQVASDPTLPNVQRASVLEELVQCGKPDLVRNYLKDIFKGGWDKPTVEDSRFRLLAFRLSPTEYITQILDALTQDNTRGRQWIESVVGARDVFLPAMLECDPQDIANMYAWLHREYPANTCPEHEDAYTPMPIDDIHMLKNHLINHLAECGKPGASKAIESIFQQFPQDAWLNDCILEAKSAEHTNSCPVMTFAQILELSKKKGQNRCLINSIQDLSDLLNKTIKEYQKYLQGDNPAIKDLWETAKVVRPRDEEYLSDHLARYLE